MSIQLNIKEQNTFKNEQIMNKQYIEMKKSIIALLLLLVGMQMSFAQSSSAEQEIKDLSKAKWQWMADKDVDKLASLFHDKSKFVHMSGTWKKDEELEIIKTGSIWYRKADVHDVAVEIDGNVAVLWNRITLESEVRGNDAKVEFTVTEVYKKERDKWKLLALTFSSVRDTHVIKH